MEISKPPIMEKLIGAIKSFVDIFGVDKNLMKRFSYDFLFVIKQGSHRCGQARAVL